MGRSENATRPSEHRAVTIRVAFPSTPRQPFFPQVEARPLWERCSRATPRRAWRAGPALPETCCRWGRARACASLRRPCCRCRPRQRRGSLAQLVALFKACAASAALIQRLDLRLRVRHPGTQGHCSRLGMAQGPHHEAPLHPGLACVMGLKSHHRLTLIALGNQLSLAVLRLSPHRAPSDLPSIKRLQSRCQLPLGQLSLRQRAHGGSPRVRSPSSRLSRSPVAVAHIQ